MPGTLSSHYRQRWQMPQSHAGRSFCGPHQWMPEDRPNGVADGTADAERLSLRRSFPYRQMIGRWGRPISLHRYVCSSEWYHRRPHLTSLLCQAGQRGRRYPIFCLAPAIGHGPEFPRPAQRNQGTGQCDKSRNMRSIARSSDLLVGDGQGFKLRTAQL